MTITQTLNQALKIIYPTREQLEVDNFDNQDLLLREPIKAIQDALGQINGGPAAQYDIYNTLAIGLTEYKWDEEQLMEALKDYVRFEIGHLPTAN